MTILLGVAGLVLIALLALVLRAKRCSSCGCGVQELGEKRGWQK